MRDCDSEGFGRVVDADMGGWLGRLGGVSPIARIEGFSRAGEHSIGS